MKKLLGSIAVIVVIAVICVWQFGSRDPRELGNSVEERVGEVHASTQDLALPPPIPADQATPESSAGSGQIENARRSVTPDSLTALVESLPQPNVIEVLAQDLTGRPLRDIWITLTFLGDDLPARGAAGMWAVTDTSGLVSFRIPDPKSMELEAQLKLRRTSPGSNLVAQKTLEPPLVSGRVSITMRTCARIEVSLLDSSRRAQAGAYVDVRRLAQPADHQRDASDCFQTPALTNELGLAVFDHLSEGEYEFSVDDPRTHTRAQQQIRVEFEGRYFVALELPPAPQVALCVSGTIVDELDKPLPRIQVRLAVDGGEIVSVRSDESGAFTYSVLSGREVELSVGGGMWDDDFEPSSLRVPFGTKDVRLRRLRQFEVISVEFVCLDATTGEVVPGQSLSGKRYRAGAPSDSAEFQFMAKAGTTLLFKAHDDWHVLMSATGYLPQDIALADAMLQGVNGNTIEVRFVRDPGYKPN